jgi:hypothetical protein
MTEKQVKKQKLTLDNLLREELPIYVLNRSKPKGDISISIFRPDGSPVLITIPRTWIPICVTDQVPHDLLKTSLDFRRFLMNKILVLVPEEVAKNTLKSKDAQDELDRINVSKYAGWDTDTPITSFADSVEVLDKVNIRVKELLMRDTTDTERYQLFRAEEENWEIEDIEHIILNTTSDKIKAWATTLLEEKKS